MAYLYAKKGANLMLVARREDRLKAVADKSRSLGAKNVHVIAADVAKEEDCKRFIDETINLYGSCKSPFSILKYFFCTPCVCISYVGLMEILYSSCIFPVYISYVSLMEILRLK